MTQPTTLPPRLEAFALSKRFGGRTVLDAASFRIQGQVMALTGENGIGKTTLLKILTGSEPADQGRVELCGIDLHKQPLEAKRLLAYVPAECPVYPFIRGREFLHFVAGIRGQQSDDQTSFVEAFRLTNYLDQRFDQMSLGTQHKFLLVTALSVQPQVLVMDEPTNALDTEALGVLQQYLIDSQGQRVVLFASHNERFIQACASGVLRLERGGVREV